MVSSSCVSSQPGAQHVGLLALPHAEPLGCCRRRVLQTQTRVAQDRQLVVDSSQHEERISGVGGDLEHVSDDVAATTPSTSATAATRRASRSPRAGKA